MEKTKRNAIVFIMIITALSVIGYCIYNITFPFARSLEYPSDYPSIEYVQTVTITTPDRESTAVYGFAPLIQQIQKVEPTRKMSVNDLPAVEFYYKVEVVTEDKQYYYFVYEENNSVYLEIPYVGIYKDTYNSGRSSLMQIISDLIANDPVKWLFDDK